MFDLIGPFIFGFLGSVHCLGMCGPLVLAYSLHLRPKDQGLPALGPHSRGWPESAAHHFAFHAGRLLTYCVLGCLAAAITQVTPLDRVFAGLRNSVTLGGGLLMVGFGLGLAGVLPARLFSFPLLSPGAKGRGLFYRLFSSKGLFSKLALGTLCGFLPCMLSFAMIVKAATTSNVFLGSATMLLFGLGTMPALFFTGFSASLISMKTRILGERVAGAMAATMGVMLIVKAGRYFL